MNDVETFSTVDKVSNQVSPECRLERYRHGWDVKISFGGGGGGKSKQKGSKKSAQCNDPVRCQQPSCLLPHTVRTDLVESWRSGVVCVSRSLIGVFSLVDMYEPREWPTVLYIMPDPRNRATY